MDSIRSRGALRITCFLMGRGSPSAVGGAPPAAAAAAPLPRCCCRSCRARPHACPGTRASSGGGRPRARPAEGAPSGDGDLRRRGGERRRAAPPRAAMPIALSSIYILNLRGEVRGRARGARQARRLVWGEAPAGAGGRAGAPRRSVGARSVQRGSGRAGLPSGRGVGHPPRARARARASGMRADGMRSRHAAPAACTRGQILRHARSCDA